MEPKIRLQMQIHRNMQTQLNPSTVGGPRYLPVNRDNGKNTIKDPLEHVHKNLFLSLSEVKEVDQVDNSQSSEYNVHKEPLKINVRGEVLNMKKTGPKHLQLVEREHPEDTSGVDKEYSCGQAEYQTNGGCMLFATPMFTSPHIGPTLHTNGLSGTNETPEATKPQFWRPWSSETQFSKEERQIKPDQQSTKIFKCSFCGNTFTRKWSLEVHHRTQHAYFGNKSSHDFTCSFCGKIAGDKYGLEDHIRGHTKEKPFGCPLCPDRLQNKASFDRHLQNCHQGWGICECEVCGRKFSTLKSKQLHKARYHGINGRPTISCAFCDRTFHLQSQLQFHLQQHTRSYTSSFPKMFSQT